RDNRPAPPPPPSAIPPSSGIGQNEAFAAGLFLDGLHGAILTGMDSIPPRSHVPDHVSQAGGLTPGVSAQVAEDLGLAEAHVYGSSSFFHLLADPDTKVRVCTGLSCQLKGAQDLLERAQASGLPAKACSCLAACDAAPAVLRDRRVLPSVTSADIDAAAGKWQTLQSSQAPGDAQERAWRGHAGPKATASSPLSIDLLGEPDYSAASWVKAQAMGADDIIAHIKSSGLQGRGGAGFPAHIKWSAVRAEPDPTKYVVLNADEPLRIARSFCADRIE
ncbi:MAG: hypothetical protein ACI9X4_002798, partial [Glaciecola sp.]